MSKLDEIRERWDKTTPGPWALDPAFWSPPNWDETMHYRRVVHGEPNKISGIRQPLFSTNGAADGSEQARQNHRDASAVAHAREDVPWLLAKLDRVEEQVKRIQETIHPTGNPMDTPGGVPQTDCAAQRGDTMSKLDDIRRNPRITHQHQSESAAEQMADTLVDHVAFLLAEVNRLTEAQTQAEHTRDEWKGMYDVAFASQQRVQALAEEMAGQHGQCWNSITARRIRDALRGGE